MIDNWIVYYYYTVYSTYNLQGITFVTWDNKKRNHVGSSLLFRSHNFKSMPNKTNKKSGNNVENYNFTFQFPFTGPNF